MTHSKVFTDGDTLFVLVAHPEDAEEKLTAPDGYQLYGLMVYSVSVEGGEMFVYILDDEESMYAPDERWKGVDLGAVKALLEAAESGEAADMTDGFYQIKNAYERRHPDDPVLALGGLHPVGTVVRLDYGSDDVSHADVFVKRDADLWEVTGGFTTYTDEEMVSETFEVIYNV